ncbi:MAG: primosomal protein N' [Candidatus Magasanikbacteria bacterium RIFOXYC2_FULL_42_28]|uniref:Primosomal protein N n=1 Tax=Candidatus Magasanikbacteria bacterium RIFOXYC2_FULL_42_28 TaxID=1798704 RepID=A0A1F6NXH5_9BACT|nr:MAG: primosomal protein N' [Candidatus Magasanikbacteria bacterium RIFOXYC2_FULL_42_28]
MFYVKVAPVRRLPLKLQILDYLAPEHLAPILTPGQLVKIPFMKKEIFGVVTEINPGFANATLDKPEKIKSISSIFLEKPIISAEQLNFLIETAVIYHTPLGFLLKENLPPLQPRKLAKLKLVESNAPTTPGLEADPSSGRRGDRSMSPPARGGEAGGVGAITMSAKPELFIYKTKSEKIDAIKKIIGAGEQTLILVPEVNQIKELEKKFGDSAIVFHGDLSPKIKFERWWQVWRREKKMIIGTRAALFLPFFGLQDIILDDEENPSYKSWDMAPRYHTRDAVLMLSRHHGSTLTLLAHTPSVESYFFAKANVYNLVNKLEKFLNPIPELIDLRDERRGGNYNIFSDQMLETAKNAPTGDWFFYVNRRGSAGYVGCRDCGYVSKCQKCERGLVYHRETNNLQCHYCKISSPMNTHCPSCKGVNVVMYGAGTETVEGDARRMFPDRAIVRLDADTIESYKPNLEDNRPKIYIGTQMAWMLIDWEKLSLMVMVEADSALFIPEYKTTENLFLQIREAQFRLPETAKFLIQTAQIDHVVYNALYNPERFYAPELQTRKQFQYPPFYYLLRVLCGVPNSQDAEMQINQYLKALQTLTKDEKKVIIFGPLQTTPYYQQGKYWQIIVVKLPYEKYKDWTKKISAITPPEFKFDPNPNTLLSLN